MDRIVRPCYKLIIQSTLWEIRKCLLGCSAPAASRVCVPARLMTKDLRQNYTDRKFWREIFSKPRGDTKKAHVKLVLRMTLTNVISNDVLLHRNEIFPLFEALRNTGEKEGNNYVRVSTSTTSSALAFRQARIRSEKSKRQEKNRSCQTNRFLGLVEKALWSIFSRKRKLAERFAPQF